MNGLQQVLCGSILKVKNVKNVKTLKGWGYIVEVSRISSKGQVTIPKSIRQLLNLNDGDRVAFLEDNGKVMIAKASLIALRELQDALGKEARKKGITEQDLLKELEVVREEMWNERKK